MVLVGPQRDDLIIELDGKASRNFASQGQIRSLVLAFKLAELNAARDRGEQLIFLLDDLTSELDRGRMFRLIELLGELKSQVWMTTTDPDWLGPLPVARTVSLKVHQGMVIST
jgi:DNA replication and repair protein RecF